MTADHRYPCAHPVCICEVQESGAFCSDHCREAAASGSDTCACGHVECAVEPETVAPALALA